MLDIDDPGWSWPAWKFGMKRDDLFTKLHDQYNTFSFNIQDPEAFHHDVYEISRNADTTDEFHRLMADRQRQRLTELHESLESLAVEIIANPKLMDSEHWQYALQLFRTRSFDSIVRYFASYLPDNYLDQHETASVSSSTYSETNSVKTESTSASSVDDASLPRFFGDDEFVMTKEPLSIHTNIRSSSVVEAPLSPPNSEAMHSDSCACSPAADLESHGYSSNPPSRSMSFSGSESGPFVPDLKRSHVDDDDETSQSDDCESAVTSDCAESPSSMAKTIEEEHVHDDFDEDFEDEFPVAQFPEDAIDAFDFNNDTLDSDTPTPRQETIASCYIEYKSVVSRRIPSPHRRSPSPSPRYHRSSLMEIRRSPDESLSKIQKPTPDPIRRRAVGRRRLD
ncbi:hypothetical protein EDB81DRAFT_880770 [Dactylonectria macrodidyma]|uniref:Uncharacterized protein n=1 Tax=Dactylonectria macrodidyma TaxID=307937 RepID=A0A9P9J8K9_9HYPO|nr:hypothetical protein EDB81DRAFT_880770 [Dactylonectria macrodidyma]